MMKLAKENCPEENVSPHDLFGGQSEYTSTWSKRMSLLETGNLNPRAGGLSD
jgi:hypothetical protein